MKIISNTRSRKRDSKTDPLIHDNPLPAWMYDAETFYFLDVNEAAVEQYGYSRRELLGMRLTDILAKREVLEQTERQSLLKAGKMPLLKKDGSPVWVRVKNQRRMFDGHEVVLMTMQDEVFRKRRQEKNVERSIDSHLPPAADAMMSNANPAETTFDIDKLRESEERYRDLVESSHVLMCTHDLSGRLLSVNASMIRSTGYKEAELIGKYLQDFLTPEERAFFSHYLRVIQARGSASGQMTLVTASGEKRIWEYRNTLRADGIVRGVAYDITKRVEMEEALQESEERFRTLFENTTIGFYRTTPDGQILMANPALVRMLGFDSFEELSRRNLEESDYEAKYSRKEFKERIERDGRVIGLEAEWITKQGDSIYVRESARTVKDERGNILYYEGTVEDITDRRRAEMEMIESENRYRRLFEDSPICIWEEDFTGLKQYLENLRSHGVLDFDEYFERHPEEISYCASLIKVLNVNRASLPIFDADRKEQLLGGIDGLMVDESRSYFKRELIAIAGGAKTYEGETVGHTLKGRKKFFFFRWTEIP